MLSATVWLPALGRLRAVSSSTDTYFGLSRGRATLGQFLCNMSYIVIDNHSEKKSHHIGI